MNLVSKNRLLALTFSGIITISMIVHAGPVAEARKEAAPIAAGAEVDYPPFSFVDAEGRATGFSVELMQAALTAMGRKVDFQTGIWSDVRSRLENGEIDALPLVGRTPERERLFDFTFPYMTLHGAVVVRNDTTGIRTLDDLRGRKVAVMKGDNAEEFLRRQDRGIDILTTPSFEAALADLSAGRYDAVVIQRLVALRLIQETGLANLRILNRPIEDFRQDFCFAVREGDRETLALLNEGLALVMADGTYRHLHARWFAALELPLNRRIVIGGDDNYPPYEYLDENGRPAGYNVDLTRAIARELSLDIEIRLAPWTDIRNALARGEIDALQGMFYSPRRDLAFDFSPPHMVNHCVAVVRAAAAPPPTAVADLVGKRVVVQEGDIMHDFVIENGLGDQVTVVPTQEDALRELAEGRHDCALVSRMTALYWIKKYGWRNLSVGRRPLFSAGYAYAVPQHQRPLLAELSEGLKMIEDSGEYRRIFTRWMGVYEAPTSRFGVFIRYAGMAAVPLLLILLAFFLWTWSLRKQVALKTMHLEKSEKRFRRAIEEAPFPIMIHAEDGEVMTLSRTWKEISGYTGEAAGTIDEWTSLAHGDRKVEARAVFSRIYRPNDPHDDISFEIVCRDGSVRIWNFSSTSLGKLPDGRGIAITMAADITDLKGAHERIQHLNHVLRAIRDVNQLIIRERDPAALIREGCRLLVDHRGYDSALIVLGDENGRPVSWSGNGMAFTSETLTRMLESGQLPNCCAVARLTDNVLVIDDREGVCEACPVNGVQNGSERQSLCAQLRYEECVFGYIVVAVRQGLIVDDEELGLFTEIAGDLAYALHGLHTNDAHKKVNNERMSLEKQLIQAQKLESIGRLAGGVAHDYNNMLSVIMGYTEMAIEKTSPSAPIRYDLNEILAAAHRSANITRQLLTFARRETIAPRVLDLNAAVKNTLNMLRRLIGEDVALIWRPRTRLWPVKIDPTQVDQILANLCINARDAITDVGRIIIETDCVTLGETYVGRHLDVPPGEYVALSVTDTGCGMDRETAEQIFEPFFTTKNPGTGTGLGLATVYGIVKQNRGIVNVYSEPGRGSVFRIYLPRFDKPKAEKVRAAAEEIQKGRGEWVLLVEDEASILKLMETMLHDLDYKVLPAKSPAEALDLAATTLHPITFLITDVVMPEMNGRELAEKLRRRRPSLRCLFMSGYTDTAIAHHGVLMPGVNFIQKPFSIKDLSNKIRTILEAEG